MDGAVSTSRTGRSLPHTPTPTRRRRHSRISSVPFTGAGDRPAWAIVRPRMVRVCSDMVLRGLTMVRVCTEWTRYQPEFDSSSIAVPSAAPLGMRGSHRIGASTVLSLPS